MHRVGLIGAGQISAFHASALRRIPNAELACIYDVDAARAQEAARRFGAKAVGSPQDFRSEGIDAVHVLTPPDAHEQAALEAIAMGMHVLVEKPLATDAAQCRRIGEAARAAGVRVCVDHSLLYDPQFRKALTRIRGGAIGEPLSAHMFRSAEYPPYEGGPLPPHYRSAGYPFRDLGVHQLYLLQALFGDIRDVRASWKSLGGDPNLTFDEWRMEVTCSGGAAGCVITFNARPIQNVITVYGTRGVMSVDMMRMFTTRRAQLPIPKALERASSAYAESLQSALQVTGNTAAFAAGRIRQFHGVQALIAEFYRSLDEGRPVPVGVEDALPVVEWVERIARGADADAARLAQKRAPLDRSTPIVVTGAAGALGSAVVSRLRAEGNTLRAFVRPHAVLPGGVEAHRGDLGDPQAVDEAVRGARIVIHIGAATKGGWIVNRASTVVGTQNVIDACLRHGVEQLVYISSLSVVDWNGARSGTPISESSALEPLPEKRGAYTRAKLEAEMLVRAAVETRGLPAVILRPGQIFGGRLPLVTAAVARRVGKWFVVLGNGKQRLPLVYIDDVVDAICLAMERRLTGGEIVQLVDDRAPTQNEILHVAHAGAPVLRLPAWLVFAGGALSEALAKLAGRTSPFSRYRLRSAMARRTFTSENAERVLQWRPNVGVTLGMERAGDL